MKILNTWDRAKVAYFSGFTGLILLSSPSAQATNLVTSADNLGNLFKKFGNAMVFGAMAIGIVLIIVGLAKLAKNSQQDTMMDKIWPLVAGAFLLAIGGVVGIASGTFGFTGDKGDATGLFN